jgi:hypothetical protein
MVVADPRRLLGVAAAAGAAAAGIFVLYRFDPTSAGFYPQCLFHALTGFDCPGCGGTRALHALLHGHVGGAIRFNPMLFLYVPILAFGTVDLTRAFLTHTPPRNITTRPWLAWSIVVTVVGWWIVRNTPLWPH